MQVTTSQKVKTGAFVVGGLAVLLMIIFFIGNQKNLFRSTIRVHINYRTVAGLQEGNFVRFAGINVGSVDLIEIINDTTVRVDVSIQKKVQKFIKADSKANIANDGLMGDKLIQINSGSDKSTVVAEGGELVAVNPFDMEKIMAKIEKVGVKVERIVNNVDTLSGQLSGIFGKVNNGKGTLGKLINSEKLANDLQQTVNSAKKTVKTIDSAAGGIKDNMDAAKHNFLLKGFFNKKEKKRIADSIAKAKDIPVKEAKPIKKN